MSKEKFKVKDVVCYPSSNEPKMTIIKINTDNTAECTYSTGKDWKNRKVSLDSIIHIEDYKKTKEGGLEIISVFGQPTE